MKPETKAILKYLTNQICGMILFTAIIYVSFAIMQIDMTKIPVIRYIIGLVLLCNSYDLAKHFGTICEE